MSFDIIIRGGTVVTAADTFACDVGIRDGKIAALGHDLGDATAIIDATDRLVLPGGIDSHVHLAQPAFGGPAMADGFESGTRSAIAGGNTTVIPFALQSRGMSLRQAVTDYHAEAAGQVAEAQGGALGLGEQREDADRAGHGGRRGPRPLRRGHQ